MIVIVGYGHVGSAYHQILDGPYATDIVDPKLTTKTLKDIEPKHVKGVIICVNAPTLESGVVDDTTLFKVLDTASVEYPILIKSTIPISTWKKIEALYPHHTITYSPEFLTEKYATSDLLMSEYMYLAGGNTAIWQSIFQLVIKDCKFVTVTPEEAILGKYVRNSFLATKVAFFNQVYDVCQSQGIDFEKVKRIITDDERIGKSHSSVTVERGYGGSCFPKDVKALYTQYAELTILKNAHNYNDIVRKLSKLKESI